MKITTLFAALITLTCAQADEPFPYQLRKTFETSGFQNPESAVVHSSAKAIYVSNVNGAPTQKDNSGYISKVSLQGKIINQKWITGLHAPKGMAIHQGKLYVADIDTLVEINIGTGHKTSYKAPEATFLNDVAVDPETGDVYTTNTFGVSAIYKLSNHKISLWMQGEKLNHPNGITVQKNQLLVSTWGANPDPKTFATKIPGKLLTIDIKSQAIKDLTPPLGNLDGIAPSLHGHFLSDWMAGTIIYRASDTGKTFTALQLPKGAADIIFHKPTKTLYVPLMIDGSLQAYQLSK